MDRTNEELGRKSILLPLRRDEAAWMSQDYLSVLCDMSVSEKTPRA